ncbi:Allantoinase [compost metagenome]|nr:hypothetical protein N183_26645 [Sinorhizobium sp. Sb3]
MSFDLIVKGGTLPDGNVADIGINGDRIAAIEPSIDAAAGRVVDASGNLVSQPFVDPHFHMGATRSYGTKVDIEPLPHTAGEMLQSDDLHSQSF